MGAVKRERVSFTISPNLISWLKSEASSLKESKSTLLEKIINDAIEKRSAKGGVRNFPRVHIPKQKIEEFCKRHSIKNLYLFGSVLRSDFSSKSDIDILAEFLPENTPTYFQLFSMEGELSGIFGGRKVDLRTIHELSRYFRDQVREEAELLYAA